MSFIADNLTSIGGNSRSGIVPALNAPMGWAYQSLTDDRDAVEGVGYFDSFSELFVAGQFIYANLTDGKFIFTIATVDRNLKQVTLDAIPFSPGANQTLAETLVLGNVTGGTSIILSDGDLLATSAHTGQVLNLNSSLTTGFMAQLDADSLTTGIMLRIHSNSSSTASRALINLQNNNAAAVATTCLFISNNAPAGFALSLEGRTRFNSNNPTGDSFEFIGSADTTGDVVHIEANALTTGRALHVQDASPNIGSRNSALIHVDNPLATGATCLMLQQDSAGRALAIDANTTAASIINVIGDSLTTGKLADFTSDSSDSSIRKLMRIRNLNLGATATDCLSLEQSHINGAPALRTLGGVVCVSNNTILDSFKFDAPENTEGIVFSVVSKKSTTGTTFFVEDQSPDTSLRDIAFFRNSDVLATGATVVKIVQNANARALDIFSDHTTNTAVFIRGDSLTTGTLLDIRSNSAVSGPLRTLVDIRGESTADIVETVVNIQSATGFALARALTVTGTTLMTSVTDTGIGLIWNLDSITSGTGISVSMDGLTTGRGFFLESNATTTSLRRMLLIANNSTLSSGTTLIDLFQNADNRAMRVNAFGVITQPAFLIEGPALTTGKLADFNSNSASTSSRILFQVHNDNVLATGATCLGLLQDSPSAPCLKLTQSSGIVDFYTRNTTPVGALTTNPGDWVFVDDGEESFSAINKGTIANNTDYHQHQTVPPNVIQVSNTADWEAALASTFTTPTSIILRTTVGPSASEITVSGGTSVNVLTENINGAMVLYSGTSPNTLVNGEGSVRFLDAVTVVSISTGGFQNLDASDATGFTGVLTLVRVAVVGFDDLGTMNEGILLIERSPFVDFNTGFVLINANVAASFSAMVNTTPVVKFFTVNAPGFGNANSSLFSVGAINAASGSSLIRVDPGLNNDSRVNVSETIAIDPAIVNLFDESSAGNGTFTVVADAAIASTSVTSVTDSGGFARFNFSGGPPTVFVHQEIDNSSFTTDPLYNGKHIIIATDGTTFYETRVIFNGNDTGGAFTSESVTITDTATALVDGDTGTIDTDLSAFYDGGFTVYNQLTNTFQINRLFGVTATGNWSQAGLGKKDPRVLALNNTGFVDSKSIACAFMLGNVTNTTSFVNGTYQDINFGTLTESSVSERWKLIDVSNGTFENTGVEPFDGNGPARITFTGQGGTNDPFKLKWVIDKGAGFVDLDDLIELPFTVSNNQVVSPAETVPFKSKRGDLIKRQIVRDSGSANILASGANLLTFG